MICRLGRDPTMSWRSSSRPSTRSARFGSTGSTCSRWTTSSTRIEFVFPWIGSPPASSSRSNFVRRSARSRPRSNDTEIDRSTRTASGASTRIFARRPAASDGTGVPRPRHSDFRARSACTDGGMRRFAPCDRSFADAMRRRPWSRFRSIWSLIKPLKETAISS